MGDEKNWVCNIWGLPPNNAAEIEVFVSFSLREKRKNREDEKVLTEINVKLILIITFRNRQFSVRDFVLC